MPAKVVATTKVVSNTKEASVLVCGSLCDTVS